MYSVKNMVSLLRKYELKAVGVVVSRIACILVDAKSTTTPSGDIKERT